MMIIRFVTFLLCLCVSVSAYAEKVHVKNGDIISGEIIGADSQKISIKTVYGVVNIPHIHVVSIENHVKKIILKPKKEIQTVANEAAISTPVEKIEEPKGFLNAEWSGRVALGGKFQTGNSDKNKINADGQIKSKWEKHRLELKADYNREEDSNVITVDNASATGIYDYFYSKKWFVESSLKWAQDDIDKLDARYIASLGIGHQAYERDDLNLKYVFGPSYVYEEFSTGDSESDTSLKWRFDYDQKFWSGKFQIFHDHSLLTPADNVDAYLFESKSGVRVPLSKGLLAIGQVDFDWDNEPEIGTVEDDTIYSLKLGYEW